MSNSPQTTIERLKGFKRKSEVQRQAHADLASRYSKYIIGSNIFNIFASGIIAFLALSDSRKVIEPFQLLLNLFGIGYNFNYNLAEKLFAPVLGFSGLAIFLLSLLGLICGWSDMATKHSEGVRLFTDLITDIRDTIDRGSCMTDSHHDEDQIGEIKKRYLLICSVLPHIPNKFFSKSKKRYMMKREKSEEMDEIKIQ